MTRENDKDDALCITNQKGGDLADDDATANGEDLVKLY
jgi:hypothetical protein